MNTTTENDGVRRLERVERALLGASIPTTLTIMSAVLDGLWARMGDGREHMFDLWWSLTRHNLDRADLLPETPNKDADHE
jgi:hypothetical protein